MPKALSGFFGAAAVPGYDGRVSDPARLYQPELLGLRAVAILIIVSGHLLQRIERFDADLASTALGRLSVEILATPFTGCRMLFFISGYTLLLQLHGASLRGDIALGRLIGKSVFRLWPPYLCVLLATYLFISATGYQPTGTTQFESAPQSLTHSLLASAIFLHMPLFDTFPRLFPPGWFLETHVQFLIAGPFVWWAYLRAAGGRRRLVAGLAGLVLSSALSMLVIHYGSRAAQYSLIAFLPYFFAGALLADCRIQFAHRWSMHGARGWSLVGWLGVAILIAIGGPFGNPLLQQWVHLVCLTLIVQASFARDSGFHRVMASRWIARIGITSYSTYLVHLQILQVVIPRIVDHTAGLPTVIIVAACYVAGFGIVMLAALGFYWLIERPSIVMASRAITSS